MITIVTLSNELKGIIIFKQWNYRLICGAKYLTFRRHIIHYMIGQTVTYSKLKYEIKTRSSRFWVKANELF